MPQRAMSPHSTTARAHPNIALLKYWGKQEGPGNLPAAPSLSITLGSLITTTRVREAPTDSVSLNGEATEDPKISAALADWRRDHEIPPLAVTTRNSFPTAAGLASSAAGFAALATAVDAHCRLGLSAGARSALARRGSASAARSVFGGFVALAGPDWQAAQLMSADSWPLQVVIAITSTVPKAVSSREGMAISRRSSPYFDAWVAATARDFPAMREALRHRDFARLAELSEASCLRMHALMMSGDPALIYWNAGTLHCIEALRRLRETGRELFFTVDAGPQVKAVCEARHTRAVRDLLRAQPGVQDTVTVGLGGGATLVNG